MTGIRNLLDEVADEARVYAVVASAKAGARRRRRVLRMLAAGTASVAVLGMATGVYIALGHDSGVGVGPAASAEPSASPTAPGPTFPAGCSAEQLPTPEGYLPRGVVTGMDPTGRFVLGRAYPANGQPSVLVWDNGAVTAVSMPGIEPALVNANSSGLAVGYTHAANDTFQAYVYRDGTLTKLADRAQAFAVNEAGAILGKFWSDAAEQPVLWPSASAAPVPLAMPADTPIAILTQLADDGAVIGYLVSEDYTGERPVLWHPDGSRLDLQWPSLPGPEGQAVSAHGLRAGRGEWTVVEVYAEQAPLPATYVWNVRTGQTLPLAEASDLVGTLAWSIVRSQRNPDASLVSGQHSLTLPRLPGVDYDGDPLRISLTVNGISEDGHLIAAHLMRAHATARYDDLLPLVWHCE